MAAPALASIPGWLLLPVAVSAFSHAAFTQVAPEAPGAPEPPAAEQPAPGPEPAPPVQTEPAPSGPPPGAYREPSGAPPILPPPSAEYGRRPVELVPSLALLFPQCSGGDRSSDGCEGVSGGLGVEFSALWRVFPYFAWGGTLELGGLGYEPPNRLALRNGSAGMAFIGVLGRAYFVDEGAFDPYLELGIGGGAMGTRFTGADDVTYDNTGAGPALRIGAGIDFYLSRSLRLGPSVAATRLFVDKIRRCEAGGGSCIDLSKDDDGYLAGVVSIGVKLTIMIGDEM